MQLECVCGAGHCVLSPSPGLLLGLQPGSSKAAGLWPEVLKKEKAKRKLGWFSVDCPGLPALLELHSQSHGTWSELQKGRVKLSLQHNLMVL